MKSENMQVFCNYLQTVLPKFIFNLSMQLDVNG